MIVRLVTHGNLFLSDFSPQLAVHKIDPTRWRWGLLPEAVSHVMEQLSGAGEERRQVIHVIEKILGGWIALLRCQCEPADSGIPVLGNILSQEIQLTESVLCKLVSLDF